MNLIASVERGGLSEIKNPHTNENALERFLLQIKPANYSTQAICENHRVI